MARGDEMNDAETTLGPVQLLVLGFAEPKFDGRIRQQLDRLRKSDVIRLIDMIVVRKDAGGDIEAMQLSDLSVGEAEEFGAYAGALIGLGAAGDEGAEIGAELGAAAGEDGHLIDEDQVWYIADAIPENTAAAVALIEHVWAIPLREAIVEAGGVLLADAWIHPGDLAAIGLTAAAEIGA
jgi:uncharacterized membrane protein